jgi:NAD(P)-dependent dehydrogenase (short-subunit alcohol dehydrogenase family)
VRAGMDGPARPPLEGRIALVTGGARGLGAAICRTLGAAGATVAVADLRRDLADATADAVRGAGGKARALELDVTDARMAEDAVGEVVAEFGGLDALVNNAGTDRTAPVEALDVGDWDRILAVNLRAPFVLSRLVFPLLRARGGGHVVNVVSTAAKRAWPNASAYHASKWGLLGLSHALHVEGRPQGIKVTAVIAGGMRTPFVLDRFPDLDPALLQDPENVARAVLFALTQPDETVVPELTVIPMRETSWP